MELSSVWADLPLLFDWEKRLVLCRHCHYALAVTGTQVGSHLRQRHQIPIQYRKGLDRFIQRHGFRTPTEVPPRHDGSPKHPGPTGLRLPPMLYRSTSLECLSRHVYHEHLGDTWGPSRGPRNIDHLYRDVALQA